MDFKKPEPVGFDAALTYVKEVRQPDMATLVTLDQPTIVPNATGMRPVEKAVSSLIGWMGGGVQPANRGRTMFFGEAAPIWRFLENLAAIEDPEMARVADQGVCLMEVFPALALASFESAFFGRLKGPRYNPDRRTFRIGDWIATIDAAIGEAHSFSCTPLIAWLSDLRTKSKPRKADQDCLDSVLCLLVALRWRLCPREMSVAVGDLNNGYIVAPLSATVMQRLTQAALERGVPINALSGPAAAFQLRTEVLAAPARALTWPVRSWSRLQATGDLGRFDRAEREAFQHAITPVVAARPFDDSVAPNRRRFKRSNTAICKCDQEFVIRRCGNLGSSDTYWLQEPPSSLDWRGCRRAHP